MTAAKWPCGPLRRVGRHRSKTKQAKLRAIAEASRHQFPTADIDVMLKEIEAGRRLVPPTR